MGYSLGEGKREKPLVVAWPRRKFHGKTTDDQFSVVCGGVCPVSHPSQLPHSLHCSQVDHKSLRATALCTRLAHGERR